MFYSRVILCLELHLIVKSTSTASTPKYVDVKPRKPAHKEKPKKWKRLKGRKDTSEYGDAEEEQEVTTAILPELRTPIASQTATPSPSRSPSWISLSNAAVISSVGYPITLGLIFLYCLCQQ